MMASLRVFSQLRLALSPMLVRTMATGQASGPVTNDLTLLHASDIHNATHKVDQLKEWLTTNSQRVDMVLVSGDVADMPLEMCYTASQKETEKQHQFLNNVLQMFTSLSNRIYYIPGNHDAITTFRTEGLTSTDSPCNVHLRKVCIAPNLHVIGMGGSVPVYQDGEQCWDGFPYKTEEEYAKDLSKILDASFLSEDSDLTPQDAVILMTHDGPNKCGTTISHVNPHCESPYYAGSTTLYKYLCEEHLQNHVVMNIHGHSHNASGQITIGKSAVINPGPLMEGYFGIYTLRVSRLPSWKLADVTLHRLPTS